MTLTAIHKVTGTRIVSLDYKDIKAEYDEWDQLICPITRLPVFFRPMHLRGEKTIVRQHFAVKTASEGANWPEDIAWDPELGTIKNECRRVGGESADHLEMKGFLANELLKVAGPSAVATFEEVITIRPPVNGQNGKRRIADLAIRYPSGFMEVHEVQLSGITKEEMQERTDDYAEAGLPVTWWVGKSAADRYELRDYLRGLHGGFRLFEFREIVSESAQHLVEQR